MSDRTFNPKSINEPLPPFGAGLCHTNNIQVGGDHYQKAIQPWDYIAANGLDYFQGNVIKYVTRFRDKNGIEDLKKAQHYLQKLIELEEQKCK